MIPKIIFLDIDGTLAGMGGEVPPSALTACREARRRGHLLYICTGRPRVYISDAILAIGFDGVISAGGARIETGSTSVETPYQGTVIFESTMPAVVAREVAAYLNEKRCGFSIEKNDTTLPNRYLLLHWETVTRRLRGEEARAFAKHIAKFSKNALPENPPADCYENINKIIFVESGSVSLAAIKRDFAGKCEIFQGSIPHAGKESGEIGPAGVHKGSALEFTAKYHDIPLANTIAFGDSDNDRTMLKRAGIGIAMGNAAEELKAVADDVTDSLYDDGIFNGFKKHGLI